MRVKDLMTAPAITISVEAALSKALDLLVDRKLSGLAVVDDQGQLCGVLSEGDVMRRIELGTTRRPGHWWSHVFSSVDDAEAYRLANGRKVSDLMSPSPVTIDAMASLSEAAALMEKHRIKRLPVLREGELVGMLSRADFVKTLRAYVRPAYEEPATSDEEIRQRIINELRAQRWAQDCSFTVLVDNGRVTLLGSAARDSQRRAACVAAENVIGVQSVEDKIDVLDPVPFPAL